MCVSLLEKRNYLLLHTQQYMRANNVKYDLSIMTIWPLHSHEHIPFACLLCLVFYFSKWRLICVALSSSQSLLIWINLKSIILDASQEWNKADWPLTEEQSKSMSFFFLLLFFFFFFFDDYLALVCNRVYRCACARVCYMWVSALPYQCGRAYLLAFTCGVRDCWIRRMLRCIFVCAAFFNANPVRTQWWANRSCCTHRRSRCCSLRSRSPRSLNGPPRWNRPKMICCLLRNYANACSLNNLN